MGIKTRIYKIKDDLAINIPSQVLPPSRMQLVEERVETPGHLARTTSDYYVLVRPYTDRTAILLTPNIGISSAEAMSNLGLDPDKPIYIRLSGTKEWIQAHKYHGYYGRVWIPRYLARETNLRRQTVYPVLIQGTTYPHIEIRMIRHEVRDVTVTHMGKKYNTENYDINKWRWRLPKNIESHPVITKALTLNIYPEAECHLHDETILVDFVITRAAARIVSEATGYAFRNMAVRNYTATVEVDYPFLCEIRATYLSCTPKMFYQPDEVHITILKKALEITIFNILQHFFQKLVNKETGEDLPYSTMSWADHIDAIDYTSDAINLKRTYPEIPLDERWKEKYLSFTSAGEGVPSEELGAEKTKYYYCIKYVRVLNESSYKEGEIDRWVYLNDDIENIIRGRQHLKITKGLEPDVDIDMNGFIWMIK